MSHEHSDRRIKLPPIDAQLRGETVNVIIYT